MRKFFAAVIASVLALACSDSNTAGATSETTNGFAFTVVNDASVPVALARVTLYAQDGSTPVAMVTADSSGNVVLEDSVEGAFVEGISDADSSQMSWDAFDTARKVIQLAPSAELTFRTGAVAADSAKLFDELGLESTPYRAVRKGSDYTFGRVPQGKFNVAAGGSTIASVEIAAGEKVDSLIRVESVTKEFVFEDFDDGDSLNNLAKDFPNYGWYVMPYNDAVFEAPDSIESFTKAIVAEDAYKGLSLSTKFNLGESGFVLLGTHLGGDTAHFDLQNLSAIRMAVKGDAEFAVALEYYKEVSEGHYHKAFWKAQATENWSEFVFKPGEEIVDVASDQVSFAEIKTEIGIFSIFIFSGTHLQVDEIVFEGVEKNDFMK